MDKRELVASLGCSRSTIDRGVRELETLGVLTYENGVYRTTAAGEITTEALIDFVALVAVLDEFEEVLRWIPREAFDLDPRHLADAELLVPEPGNPYAMIDRHTRVLHEATTVRVLLLLTGLHAHEAAHNAVVNNGADCEIVCTPSVVETFRSPAFVDLSNEMAETGRHHIYVSRETIPYFVGVFDETVQIGVDRRGVPQALVETDSEEVREWANGVIDGYKRRATPLEF
jgi:predicted transcriptional regulator